MFSPGGSSCWAEAHRALGSGDSGLPNSLYLKGPAGRVCLEHMALVEVDIGMTGQHSVQRNSPKPFLFVRGHRMKCKDLK